MWYLFFWLASRGTPGINHTLFTDPWVKSSSFHSCASCLLTHLLSDSTLTANTCLLWHSLKGWSWHSGFIFNPNIPISHEILDFHPPWHTLWLGLCVNNKAFTLQAYWKWARSTKSAKFKFNPCTRQKLSLFLDLLGAGQAETWVLKDDTLTAHRVLFQPAAGAVGGLTAITESWVDAWQCCFEIKLGKQMLFSCITLYRMNW